MATATLKSENYNILTLHLTSIASMDLEDVLREKARNPNAGQWLKTQPLIIDISNVPNKSDMDFRKLVITASKYGFNLIGISSLDDKAIMDDLITRHFPVVSKKKAGVLNSLDKGMENISEALQATKQVEEKPVVATTTTAIAPNASVSTNNETGAASVKTEATSTTPAAEKPVEATEDVSEAIKNIAPVDLDQSSTMIHVGNVRSGTQLYAKNKSLVIIGNVGDGAEVYADDCIFIFGTAKGRILAGARNPDSVVYCSNFAPQLLSIGGLYKTIEDIDEKYTGHKVMARRVDTTFEYKIQD